MKSNSGDELEGGVRKIYPCPPRIYRSYKVLRILTSLDNTARCTASTESSRLGSRDLHLFQYIGNRRNCAAHTLIAEMSHAADPEGFQRGQFARVQDETLALDRIVKRLEVVVGMLGGMHGDDDRRLDVLGQETRQTERRQAVDQLSAVAAITRTARRQAAFGAILLQRLVECCDHMGRRREAPLGGLLHVDPLVVQVQRQRMGVALALFQHTAARQHKTHARHAFYAFAGSR